MGNDPRLVPLVESGGAEAEIERLLVDVAAPLIRRIVSRHGGGCLAADLGDLESMINLRLLHKLRRLVGSPDEEIGDLEGYVARVSYNVVNDYLRRRFPERTRHKNRLRYVLTHDPRLALWNAPVGPVAGLKEWDGSVTPTATLAPDRIHAHITRKIRDRERPADALHALFGAAGGPVPLETLVDQTAALWEIPLDSAEVTLVDEHEAAPVQIERRDLLRVLWREIEQLLPMQRKALLLNLRDEQTVNVVALVVRTGTARFDDVARALQMTAERLSEIWNDLPLDDLRIAALLNVTRQQVINLRKSARERLRRRLRNKGADWTS